MAYLSVSPLLELIDTIANLCSRHLKVCSSSVQSQQKRTSSICAWMQVILAMKLMQSLQSLAIRCIAAHAAKKQKSSRKAHKRKHDAGLWKEPIVGSIVFEDY